MAFYFLGHCLLLITIGNNSLALEGGGGLKNSN